MKVKRKKVVDFLLKMYGKLYRAPEVVPELVGTCFRHTFTKRYTILDVCLRNINVRRALCRDEQHFKDVIGVSPSKFLVGIANRTLTMSEVDGIVFVIRNDVNMKEATITAVDYRFFTWIDTKELTCTNGMLSTSEIVEFMEQCEKLIQK